MKKIFISYRRAEAPHAAGALGRDLRRRYGEGQVFRDQEDIGGGVSWRQHVLNEIDRDSVLLVLIGADWANARDGAGKRRLDNPDDPIRLELTDAIKDGAAVIPVLLENAAMPGQADLPPDLKPMAELNAMKLRDGDWDHDLGRICGTLDKAGFRPTARAADPEPTTRAKARHWAAFWVSTIIGLILLAAHEDWGSENYSGGVFLGAIALCVAVYAFVRLRNVSSMAKWGTAASIALSAIVTLGYLGSAMENDSNPVSPPPAKPALAPQPVPQPAPQPAPQPIPPSGSRPSPPSEAVAVPGTVAGNWYLPNGIYWSIAQAGQQITVQEIRPGLGITGSGTGSVRGNDIEIVYVTAQGVRGMGRLQVASGGRQMRGVLQDQLGQTTAVELTR